MRHKRKNPDYTLRVLRYRAYPQSIPQSVWDIAKQQRELWNRLVTLTNQTSEWVRLLGDKKAGWSNFNTAAKLLVKESGLDWVNGPKVLDRLQTAIQTKRWPQYHSSLKVSISHRFTAGGIPLNIVINNTRSKRFALIANEQWWLPSLFSKEKYKPFHHRQPLAEHWHMRFQVGNEVIECPFDLHRAASASAVLKQVTFIGERAGSRWVWYLALTIEEPPVNSCTLSSEAKNAFAGLDLGWRVIADGTRHDYLRVGMLMDNEGRAIELRLPLHLRPNCQNDDRGLAKIAEWQGRADALINQAQELVNNRTLRQRGLSALLPILEANKAETLRGLLDHYKAIYTNRIATLHFRLRQRRRWYYQNLAQWLCQHYGQIVVEDVFLPKLHEKSDNPAFRNAAQYRNYAAVGELRAALKAAAAKAGTKILEGETEKTTIICWECGKEVEGGAGIELKCVNCETRFDQDQNAALNLMAQVEGTFGQPHSMQNLGVGWNWRKLSIPESLKATAVEIPAL